MTQPTILIAGLGPGEMIAIVVVLFLLFGGKKIPELMRGLGRGIKEFKEGKDGIDPNATDSKTNENKTL